MARIAPKSWSEFQHYKNRDPSCIKLHKRLLDDYEFQCLPVASRALAPMLWLLASEGVDGMIDADDRKLAFRLRMSPTELSDAIKPLVDSGFFITDENASDLLADRKHDASLEKRVENKKETRKKEKTPPAGDVVPPKPSFILPDWIPEEPWTAFVEMRKKIRAPLTDPAITLTLRELQKLRNEGHDPAAVLEQSTMHAWRGVFAIKEKTNGRTGKASRIDNAIEGARAFLGTPEPDSGGVAARSTQSAVSGQRGAISGPSIADPGDDHEGISGAGNAPAGSSRVRLAADGLSDAAAPVRGIFCGSETPDASGIEDGDGSLQALTRQRVFS